VYAGVCAARADEVHSVSRNTRHRISEYADDSRDVGVEREAVKA
jgi:hypothetical protein